MKRVFLILAASCSLYAQFPGAVATDKDLIVAKNRAESTLSTSINSSTLTITVANGSLFAANMLVTIDNEIIQICSVSSNTLTVCADGRGKDGTLAASHNAGRSVRGQITALHHNALATHIKAIETALGANLANLGPLLPPSGWYDPHLIQDWPLTGQDDIYVNYLFKHSGAGAAGRQFMSSFVLGEGASAAAAQWGGAGDKVAIYSGISTARSATTTLTAGIGAADLVIPVASNAIFATAQPPYPMTMMIDNEVMRVCSVTSTNVVNVCAGGRGYVGSAASHSNGATVKGLADVYGINTLCQKMAAPVEDVNINCVEIDVQNYREHFTGAAGQRSSVGLLVTHGSPYAPSHGIFVTENVGSAPWWVPMMVSTQQVRGLVIQPTTSPINAGSVAAGLAVKQLTTGGNVIQGFLMDNSGKFFEFTNSAGSAAVSIMDYQGNFVTNGSVQSLNFIESVAAAPYLQLTESDAAADEKVWRLIADVGILRIQTVNDAKSVANDALVFSRSTDDPLRMEVKTRLRLNGGVNEYANNAAALAGGLIAGDVYAVTGSNPKQLAIVF